MKKHPILDLETGLSDKHKTTEPIFERVDFGKRGEIRASKTFEDGTHYSIIDPGLENFDDEEVTWSILAKINKNGIAQIKNIINNIDGKQIKKPNTSSIGYTPTINWYFYEPKNLTLKTLGGMYEDLPSFVKEIDDAINSNLIVAGEEE
ncbi:hypothetical protein [Portibacter lacus]|nr:hypothetical protein [Portibacter lacus]